jgi:citrate lyase subunit beta/citryl-CoA lyase
MGEKTMSKKERIRRSMIFLNAHRASLVKDAFVYEPDCVIFDLEDAVAERSKDSARIQLYNTLKYVNYHGVERWARINGSDTPHYKEDIRAAVAGGIDGIRLPKTESAADVNLVEELILQAEIEFGREEGSTLLMAAIETPLGVINSYEIAKSSDRMIGIAMSGGDFTRTMHARKRTHELLLGARSQILMAARAAGVMAFDTVYTDVDNLTNFAKEVEMIADMGFDGKSCISPKQIPTVHDIFTPSQKEIEFAIDIIEQVRDMKAKGIGVFVIDGQMIDIAFVEGSKRVLKLAKAAKLYKGDLV